MARSTRGIIGAALLVFGLFAVAYCDSEGGRQQQQQNGEARADGDIRAAAQKEVDRVNAIPPNRLVIRPPAMVCETLDGLTEAIVAIVQHDADHAEAIPGCNVFTKGTRVAILDFPGPMAAHIRMILPASLADTGAGMALQGSEYYVMPVNLADMRDVPPAELLAPRD